MNVLIVNTGSSSLKIEWIETGVDKSQKKLAQISVEKFGVEVKVFFSINGGKKEASTAALHTITEAFNLAISRLEKMSGFSVSAIGHRVVHGGHKFTAPTLVTAEVLQEIGNLNSLAPLHNPIALEGVRAAHIRFGQTPNIAVFDTFFHRTIPEFASTYALPNELNDRLHIRRYGFHCIAHEAMLNRYCELTNRDIAAVKLSTLQLSSGCSIAAIRNRKSVDTSMGFTPGEGLVMGTRASDIDSGLLAWLAKKENLTIEQIENLLNTKSGLLGLSGFSDFRDLIEGADQKDNRAQLALGIYCYRIRKYFGAYLSVLNGADAIVFGGGTGEHRSLVRQKTLREMDWCGICLDAAANTKTIGTEGCISTAKSSVAVWIIPVDEAALIDKAVVEQL